MTTKFKTENIEIPKPRFVAEDEWREMAEKRAREYFDMSLDEFFEAWKEGKFEDDAGRHIRATSVAMMMPEYWNA